LPGNRLSPASSLLPGFGCYGAAVRLRGGTGVTKSTCTNASIGGRGRHDATRYGKQLVEMVRSRYYFDRILVRLFERGEWHRQLSRHIRRTKIKDVSAAGPRPAMPRSDGPSAPGAPMSLPQPTDLTGPDDVRAVQRERLPWTLRQARRSPFYARRLVYQARPTSTASPRCYKPPSRTCAISIRSVSWRCLVASLRPTTSPAARRANPRRRTTPRPTGRTSRNGSPARRPVSPRRTRCWCGHRTRCRSPDTSCMPAVGCAAR
jgi:hypothetical protein